MWLMISGVGGDFRAWSGWEIVGNITGKMGSSGERIFQEEDTTFVHRGSWTPFSEVGWSPCSSSQTWIRAF